VVGEKKGGALGGLGHTKKEETQARTEEKTPGVVSETYKEKKKKKKKGRGGETGDLNPNGGRQRETKGYSDSQKAFGGEDRKETTLKRIERGVPGSGEWGKKAWEKRPSQTISSTSGDQKYLNL